MTDGTEKGTSDIKSVSGKEMVDAKAKELQDMVERVGLSQVSISQIASRATKTVTEGDLVLVQLRHLSLMLLVVESFTQLNLGRNIHMGSLLEAFRNEQLETYEAMIKVVQSVAESSLDNSVNFGVPVGND